MRSLLVSLFILTGVICMQVTEAGTEKRWQSHLQRDLLPA
ncbi:hypothetical protein B4147_4886 [Bacillus wiedmannii]|uniref:Uncharacterized protein n=2 Tax=Bacillus cereus group TaxID=86661 RepID=A0A0G8EJH4_BACCE|nr:hypothetical protein B4147_4886 [Bacillus wiedmannii]KLA24408.1 hypothetical protein B4077_4402 [Bacillus cereus]